MPPPQSRSVANPIKAAIWISLAADSRQALLFIGVTVLSHGRP